MNTKVKKQKGYLGNDKLKKVGEIIPFSEEEQLEYALCMEDPIYFIKNYIKITTLDNGIQPFELFDYQERFIKAVHNGNRVLGLMGRQLGKTTTIAAYLVWYSIFNKAKTIAVLANKRSAAQEVMSRMQDMYMDLPKWLQSGIVEWNKGSFELENRSKAFIAATTASGIRGKSCVTSDTNVWVQNEAGESRYMTIQSIIDGEFVPTKILSSDGYRSFDGFVNQGMSTSLYRVSLSNGESIRATGDHRFMLDTGEFVETESLVSGTVLRGAVVESIDQVENQEVFDAVEVEETHDYYTNGVISHNCNFLYIDEAAIIPNSVAESFFTATYPTISSGTSTKVVLTSTPLGMNHFYKFWTEAEAGINGFTPVRVHYWEHPKRDENWASKQKELLGELKFNQEVLCEFIGSSNTLVDGKKIASLPHLTGDTLFENYTEYRKPVPNGNYLMTVDVSRGADLDYSVTTIFDISVLPYKIVGKYRDNKVSPLIFPEVIHRLAKRFNNAFVLIETNDLGQQVADILFYDLEYENVYMSYREKIQEGASGEKQKLPGIKTTKRTKTLGCQQLKTLIENDMLEVNDLDTISELSVFTRVGATYKAEEGSHDDCVMTLVLFAYLSLIHI